MVVESLYEEGHIFPKKRVSSQVQVHRSMHYHVVSLHNKTYLVLISPAAEDETHLCRPRLQTTDRRVVINSFFSPASTKPAGLKIVKLDILLPNKIGHCGGKKLRLWESVVECYCIASLE